MPHKLCIEALFDLFPKGFFPTQDKDVQDFLERIGQIFERDLDRAHDVARHTIESHKSYLSREPEDFEDFKIQYSKNKMTVFGLEVKKHYARIGHIRAGGTILKVLRDKETMRKIFLEKEAHVMLEFVDA